MTDLRASSAPQGGNSRWSPILDATTDLLEKDSDRQGSETVPCAIKIEQKGPMGRAFDTLGQLVFDCCCAPPLDTKMKVNPKKRKDGSNEGLVFKQGYLWKLNADVEWEASTDSELKKLRNWRRRNFFLVQNGDELVMVYISEKEGGRLQLGCTLEGKDCKVEAPEPVAINPLGQSTAYWATTNLQTYDVAFMDKGEMSTAEQYQEQVPKSLYCIDVHWQDRNGGKHRIAVGTSEKERDRWVKAIRVRMKVTAESK